MKIGRAIYHGVTKVIIPWFDTEGYKQYSILTFSGDRVHRKRIWREIRKFCLRNFKRKVTKRFIRGLPIVNTYDPQRIQINAELEERQQRAIDEMIQRMQF